MLYDGTTFCRADLAVHEPEAFNAIAGQAKAALV